MRAGKVQEPQPYLEPKSPRLEASSEGTKPAGEAAVSVTMQALGLESVNGAGGEGVGEANDAGEGGASGEDGATGEGVKIVEEKAEEEEVKVKPAPGTLYADLGEFEPVNLLSFAYQIASGMVCVIKSY